MKLGEEWLVEVLAVIQV